MFVSYDSYRDGLFACLDMPVVVKTNTEMEQSFGEENSKLRCRSKKASVGGQVRTRGEYVLKQIYVDKAEIKAILQKGE